jgi:hypothetical protein
MKGLNRIGVLEEFFKGIRKIDSKKAISWELKFKRYCERTNSSMLE